MATARRVVRRRPPPDWKRAVDDIIRKKRPMKLILLHECETDNELAVNPELILEVGNTLDEAEEAPRPEDEIRVLQSKVTSTHEAVCYLERRPFQVGDMLHFSGMTRIPKLTDVEGRIRLVPSSIVSGYQTMLGPGANELLVHNYFSLFPLTALGGETGHVYVPRHKVKCGFISCCGEKKIDTRESMEEILVMIIRAGIGSVFDPSGVIDRRFDESIGR